METVPQYVVNLDEINLELDELAATQEEYATYSPFNFHKEIELNRNESISLEDVIQQREGFLTSLQIMSSVEEPVRCKIFISDELIYNSFTTSGLVRAPFPLRHSFDRSTVRIEIEKGHGTVHFFLYGMEKKNSVESFMVDCEINFITSTGTTTQVFKVSPGIEISFQPPRTYNGEYYLSQDYDTSQRTSTTGVNLNHPELGRKMKFTFNYGGV